MLDILPQISNNIFLEQDDDKINHGNLYLCQPHTVIELVEVAPPPPRRITSVINSSSAASSSYSSSSSSFDEEDEDEDEEMVDDEQEEEEEEEVCSSYCSSDDEHEMETTTTTFPGSDSFARRMKRILMWRELSLSEPSLKRKLEEIDEVLVDNTDNVSHSSKRSRSHGSSVSSHSISSAELNMHPCPACDAFFPTLQSLKQHGQRDINGNGTHATSEACCVAVEYAFEQ